MRDKTVVESYFCNDHRSVTKQWHRNAIKRGDTTRAFARTRCSDAAEFSTKICHA